LSYSYRDSAARCPNAATKTISIFAPPVASTDTFAPGCAGIPYTFANAQAGSTNVWDFGDGTGSNLAAPVHTYGQGGTYSVRLIVGNGAGCLDTVVRILQITAAPVADFTAAPDSGCAPLRIVLTNLHPNGSSSFFWNFGNGDTSRLAQPNPEEYKGNSFRDTSYTITLSAGGASCRNVQKQVTIRVKALPQANFVLSSDTICSNEWVSFSDIARGNISGYAWDYGNGVTSTDSVPRPQQYGTDSLTKTYHIRLVVQGTCGSDTLIQPLTVIP